MSQISSLSSFSCRGVGLDSRPECLGKLRRSTDIEDDPKAMRDRMAEDGYLYMPGYLDRDEVMNARQDITSRLAGLGFLDTSYPLMEGIARLGVTPAFRPDVAKASPEIQQLLYSGRTMDFYTRLLGGTVRHFDFTWFRVAMPGTGVGTHCDMVYMGRGTRQLYTAWIPLGDVSHEMGGLMILENSHRQEKRLKKYLERDVDSYCSNFPDAHLVAAGRKQSQFHGGLSDNPRTLREKLGGRWLISEFQAGDLLTFGMTMVHASLDNHSDRVRLSTDSRYQLASELIDERWIGQNPIGNSLAAKRGRIC